MYLNCMYLTRRMVRIVRVSSWEHTNPLRQDTFMHRSITFPCLEPACCVPVNQEFLKDVFGVPQGYQAGAGRSEEGARHCIPFSCTRMGPARDSCFAWGRTALPLGKPFGRFSNWDTFCILHFLLMSVLRGISAHLL